MALTDKLAAIADAIRGKTGGTASLTLEEMVSAITGLSTGIVSAEYLGSTGTGSSGTTFTVTKIPIMLVTYQGSSSGIAILKLSSGRTYYSLMLNRSGKPRSTSVDESALTITIAPYYSDGYISLNVIALYN